MLTLQIPELEYYDSETGTFIEYPAVILELEHSLVSISKWESKWMKPFFSKAQKSDDEICYYIKCMSMNGDIDDFVIKNLTQDNLDKITNYIQSPSTATKIKHADNKKGPSRELVTSELIYYWMVNFNIPFECQYWHLNRLMTLVDICNIKNSPPKKQSTREILSSNAALNAARRKALNTSG